MLLEVDKLCFPATLPKLLSVKVSTYINKEKLTDYHIKQFIYIYIYIFIKQLLLPYSVVEIINVLVKMVVKGFFLIFINGIPTQI